MKTSMERTSTAMQQMLASAQVVNKLVEQVSKVVVNESASVSIKSGQTADLSEMATRRKHTCTD